jgi:hypothetical protein
MGCHRFQMMRGFAREHRIIVLGVANALRPTSLACVYALLATREPRGLLMAFVLAGLAFSLATGVIVVSLIHGADIRHGTSTFDAIVNLLAGVAALGFAAGLAQGRLQRSPRPETVREQSRIAKRLRDPSLGVAAGAGVATHLPGLLYLVGLNQISADAPPARDRDRRRDRLQRDLVEHSDRIPRFLPHVAGRHPRRPRGDQRLDP